MLYYIQTMAGMPYYIVQPGDTLYCLAGQFNTTVDVLVSNNQIKNPDLIIPGTELLVIPVRPDAEQLKRNWELTAEQYCNKMSSLMEHGIYYIGTYEWEALGRNAIPYLLDLLKNPCDTVRFHAVMSLGRIGENSEVKKALKGMLADKRNIADLARLAIRRIEMVEGKMERAHLTFIDNRLLEAPNLESPSIPIPPGTEVVVLRWHIPSPTGEEGPRGDIQLYDRVQLIRSRQVGFIPRVGSNDAVLI